ncbi:MAG TPA: 4Fe-4S binding protein [Armatimonadota bacterium]
MSKVIRKVIKINEELCNGCGQCVPSCAEGAIKIIDGKARLVSDKYCDGLGACLGECPMGALSFEEREAEEFDMGAVESHLKSTGGSLEAHNARHQPAAAPTHHHHGGCPGSRMLDFRRKDEETVQTEAPVLQSELRQWPVKLNLLNPAAPYLENADLVLAADCSAFACASFHPEFLKGHVLAIGCPKFDDAQYYVDKLTMIIQESNIKSLTVIHMEVPCCSGLLWAAQKAIEASGRNVSLEDVVISLRGDRKESAMFGGL